MNTKTLPTTNYFSIPRTEGTPRFIPFDPLNKQYYFEQDYLVYYTNYKQALLNSTIAGYPGYYLVEETASSVHGNGLLKFTRTYAPIFQDIIEGESFSALMPGLSGGVDGNPPSRASVQMLPTQSRLVTKFFLLGVSLSDCSGGYIPTKFTSQIVVKTDSDIPLMAPVPIFDSTGLQTTLYNDAVNTPLFSPHWIPDATGGTGTQTLDQDEYWAKVTAGTWMVAEVSKATRWKGYLWQRTTRYTPAI